MGGWLAGWLGVQRYAEGSRALLTFAPTRSSSRRHRQVSEFFGGLCVLCQLVLQAYLVYLRETPEN